MAPALPVRRWRAIDTIDRRAVVVEVDATEAPRALAVLQASLHDVPAGHRLGYGFDVDTVGLGQWVGDRRVRIRIWPVLVDADGTVTAEEDPDDPEAEVLAIDLDPSPDAEGPALAILAETGRLLVAGPEAGPTPLVVDLDPALF